VFVFLKKEKQELDDIGKLFPYYHAYYNYNIKNLSAMKWKKSLLPDTIKDMHFFIIVLMRI